MGKLIDTSIFVESERGRLDLDHHIRSSEDQKFFMSVITASELLHGLFRATERFRDKRASSIQHWIDRLSILDIDLEIARQHARLSVDLRAKGKLIGVHDQWLAATCLTFGLAMVTANTRDFERVQGLRVENWASF